MAISLEQDRKATLPIVKHTGIGQTFVGVIVNVQQRDQQQKVGGNWVTQTKPDGRPKREEVVTYLVIAGSAQVNVRDSDDTRTVEPGELVRYIYKGYKWSQRIDAYKALGDGGGMQVGDRHGLTVTGAVAVNDSGIIAGTDCTTDEQVLAQRMKGRNVTWNITVAARRAKPDEAQITQQAEAHYAALTTSAITLSSPVASSQSTGSAASWEQDGGTPAPVAPPPVDPFDFMDS